MIQPSQREKILIIATAALLLIVVTFVVWAPLLRSWSTASNQHAAKKRELAVVWDTLAKRDAMKKEYEGLAKGMNDPRGPSLVPDVLGKVESLARGAGVTMSRRNALQPRDRGGFSEVVVECSIEASIETLVKFLYDVKTAQDLLDVAELKITPTPADPSKLRSEVRLVSLRASGK